MKKRLVSLLVLVLTLALTLGVMPAASAEYTKELKILIWDFGTDKARTEL